MNFRKPFIEFVKKAADDVETSLTLTGGFVKGIGDFATEAMRAHESELYAGQNMCERHYEVATGLEKGELNNESPQVVDLNSDFTKLKSHLFTQLRAIRDKKIYAQYKEKLMREDGMDEAAAEQTLAQKMENTVHNLFRGYFQDIQEKKEEEGPETMAA